MTGAALLAFALVAVPQRAASQQEVPPAMGSISGAVMDAPTGSPLSGARVTLATRDPVTTRSSVPHGTASVHRTRYGLDIVRATETNGYGAYLFDGVLPGRYVLTVSRLGYSSRELEVDLGEGAAQRIVVGLELRPVQMPPLVVRGEIPQPFVQPPSVRSDIVGARVMTAHNRQIRHLSTDVRELTASDVKDAVTLGESDIFRALQRVPGVGRRDDYTAVLWTRGAPWVQTRVYFDGMPLYNPTHGGWLFSSVNPDAIGTASFHPGVRSARWGDGAAGIVDLTSRSGHGNGKFGGSAEVSLASARFVSDGELFDRVAYMVASRRTYVDLVTKAWDALKWESDEYIPYKFSDLTGRLDVDLGIAKLEASGTSEHDRLRGDIPRMLQGNEAKWGNRAGRVTLRLPLGPVHMSATSGGTRFTTVVEEDTFAARIPRWPDVVTLPEMETRIRYGVRSIAVESAPPRRTNRKQRLQWAVGYDWITEWMRYTGPFSLTGEGIPGVRPDRVDFVFTPPELDREAAWIDLRLGVVRGLELHTGLRVETGDSVRHTPGRRVAPRLIGRWTPDGSTHVSAGWGRSYQYMQAIGAAAGPLGPQLHLSNQWELAGIGIPPLRADIRTVGIERWLDDGWLIGANAYQRNVAGVREPDPRPGRLSGARNPVEAENQAHGLELSARKLAGRWTASVGYAWSSSTMRTQVQSDTGAVAMRFPSSAGVPHTVDALVGYWLRDQLRIGAAFSFASGIPFTRVVVGDEPRLEEPNAHRSRPYASLDMMMEYGFRIGSVDAGAYMQLINAFDRQNRVTYLGSREICFTSAMLDSSMRDCESPTFDDRFHHGLPRLPLFGFRVAF